MGTFTQYAITAARQALEDAEWTPSSDEAKERTVCPEQPGEVVSLLTACVFLPFLRVSVLGLAWVVSMISYPRL